MRLLREHEVANTGDFWETYNRAHEVVEELSGLHAPCVAVHTLNDDGSRTVAVYDLDDE